MLNRRNFIIFIIFAVVVLGIAIWLYQRNVFNRGVLKLEILAPNEVELGQGIEYSVKYKNNGNFVLEEPRLIFEYPEGSIFEEEKDLREEVSLEDVYPGEEKTVSFKTRLLGRENETRQAKAVISYKPKNLNTRFETSTSHTILIKFVPLTFEFDFPSKIESGRNIKILLNYFSNVDFPISNLRVAIDYPSDFEFSASKPKGLAPNEWEVGLLNKTQGGRIEIEGKLKGEVFSQKVFRARLVSWQKDRGIVLREIARGLEIIQPSVYISWQVNGSPQYIANTGDYLHYEIFFKNVGDAALENMFLVAKLSGETLDINTIQPGIGKFQKEINSIIWDQAMVPQLKLLPPLEEGKVEFWAKAKGELTSYTRNPLIGVGINLNQVKEDIATKINSKILISQSGFFSQGPFQNSGAIPPKVGFPTTYTIVWQAKSLYNDAKNVKVKAVLPSAVKLSGEIDPKDAKLSFDPNSREIVWDIGDLYAGEEGRKISFQIQFTPNSDQHGKTAELISAARITGEDVWTGSIIETTDLGIDTTLPDDPTVSDDQGIVQ